MLGSPSPVEEGYVGSLNRELSGTGKTEPPTTVPRREKLWCTHGQPTHPLPTTQQNFGDPKLPNIASRDAVACRWVA